MGFVFVLIAMFACYSAYTDASQKVVVINPGHSVGYDSGATSNYKSEAQVNQEVAGRVVRLLATQGYKVYITHTTDSALAGYKLLDQASGSSLKAVGQATNSVHPDLAISIHHNSAGSTATGYEIYWSSYRDFDTSGVYTAPNMWPSGSGAYRDSTPCAAAVQSKAFADILQSNYNGFPRLPYRKTVERDDYLPAHATSPCILIEGGFLSNPTEAAYLASDEYQNEASRRIVAAINQFFGGSGATNPEIENDTEVPSIKSVSTNVTETGDTSYSVSAYVTDNVGVGSVRVATWTEANGQDDLVWKNMQNDGNGNWSIRVTTGEHKNEIGNYINHVYAYDLKGNFVGVVAPTVKISPLNINEVGLKVIKNSSQMATAYANKLGGTKYKFAVWSENGGQDDLIWSEGTPQVDGSSKLVINRADHKNDSGKYFIHCYTDNVQFAAANEVDFGTIKTESFTATSDGTNINISMRGLSAPDGAQNVLFAVFSQEGGTDDVIWYSTNRSGNNYDKTVKISDHKGTGVFCVHAYLTDNYGIQRIIGGTSVNVSAPSTPTTGTTPTVKIENIGNNQVQVTVTGVASGLTVLAPTWSDVNGQDDLIWYAATPKNGANVAVINLNNHTGLGKYNVHVYTQDAAGKLTMVNAYTFEVTQSSAAPQAVSLDTPIMGNSGTSAAQLTNFYNSNSPVAFPDYYQNRGVSLAQFAQMYVDECNAEGVRADLAFCQMALETGFLGFGGDVSISQFNFAGLGATGGGVPGENFAAKYGDNANGIRMGIRAQVQHLKAYGSTQPLNQACVDSRFDYVTRGRATTIAGLSGTWAADTSYANKIVNFMQRIK